MNTTVNIVPSVNFIVPTDGKKRNQQSKWEKSRELSLSFSFAQTSFREAQTYLGNLSVTIPLGWTSTPLPQNLSLGWTVTWNTKPSPTTCTALTGGWWLTCNNTTLNQFFNSSQAISRAQDTLVTCVSRAVHVDHTWHSRSPRVDMCMSLVSIWQWLFWNGELYSRLSKLVERARTNFNLEEVFLTNQLIWARQLSRAFCLLYAFVPSSDSLIILFVAIVINWLWNELVFS